MILAALLFVSLISMAFGFLFCLLLVWLGLVKALGVAAVILFVSAIAVIVKP